MICRLTSFLFLACALLAAIEGLLGGVGVLACGNVESYGIYSAFYTCGLFLRVGLPRGPLLACWNVSICIGFCTSRSEQHGISGVFACFQKAFFGQVQSYGVYINVLHLLTAPARCVYLCLCASRAEKHGFFTVCWLAFRRRCFYQVI